jgi:hypothetical protein
VWSGIVWCPVSQVRCLGVGGIRFLVEVCGCDKYRYQFGAFEVYRIGICMCLAFVLVLVYVSCWCDVWYYIIIHMHIHIYYIILYITIIILYIHILIYIILYSSLLLDSSPPPFPNYLLFSSSNPNLSSISLILQFILYVSALTYVYLYYLEVLVCVWCSRVVLDSDRVLLRYWNPVRGLD